MINPLITFRILHDQLPAQILPTFRAASYRSPALGKVSCPANIWTVATTNPPVQCIRGHLLIMDLKARLSVA